MFLERAAQDLRFAFRRLRKSPGFTFAAVATFGLGIGLCSFLFSSLNGLVLQPLPGARDPHRLAAIEAPVSYPYFEHYRDESAVATSMAAFVVRVPFGVMIDGGRDARPERILGHLVSPEYFATLGTQPLLGRLFDPALERRGAAPTVVVSERFWRTRLGQDPNAAGRTLLINGQQATLVGVAQRGFLGVFPVASADVFVPVTASPAIAPELGADALGDASTQFRVVLRLAPGTTLAAAEAALDLQTRGLNEQAGKRDPVQDREGRLVRLVPAGGIAPMPSEQRSIYVVFFGLLVALILSFTCANLAGLTLARGSARSREVAIRLSLGSSRRRLVRQLLTESVMLAAMGGAVGLAAAYFLLKLLTEYAVGSGPFPSAINLTPDLRVVSLTVLAAGLAGAGFGLLPALVSTRLDLVAGLKEDSVALRRSYRRFGLRNLFMVYQIAAAMALVLIMGHMVTGLQQAAHQDPGFDPNGLFVFSLDPARDGYSSDESVALLLDLPGRLASLNGVEGVTLADRIPVSGIGAGPTTAVSAGVEGKESVHRLTLDTVGPGFFSTLGVPLLQGAAFDDGDLRSDSNGVEVLPAVINQSAAADLFGDADPLGQIIRREDKVFRVRGVVRYGRQAPFTGKRAPTVFLPLTMEDLRRGPSNGFVVAVRARPAMDLEAIREAVESIDRRLTVFNPRAMRDLLAEYEQSIYIISSIYAVVGLFALALACVGLAGVTAHALVRRRKEIGIRMALGAQRSQVLHMVMREGAAMIVAGSVAGAVAAFAISRVLASISVQAAEGVTMSVASPLRVLAAPLVLVAVAVLACYLPAQRSATIDPLAALREE